MTDVPETPSADLVVEGASTSAAQPRAEGPIRVPTRHNATLQEIVRLVNADPELHALWRCANVNAVDRRGMSDHGPVHVQIVANIGLKLLRLLREAGQEPSVVRSYGLTAQDAEVIVVLGALFHDVGIAVHRDEHEHHSLWVAAPFLRDLLRQVYPDPQARMAVWSDSLHAIICHNRQQRPMTLEAGVVRVADALDMTRGRSRIPFEAGQVNIHSVSAYAIDRVQLGGGDERPIRITVHMNNSAGIFQVDELLKAKLNHSGLEPFIEVVATIESETESRLIPLFRL
jgi:metal-dependent HD superfamily phosphatase/phosphodiesterase